MLSSEQAMELEARLILEAIHVGYGYDFRAYASDSMRRRLEAAAAKLGAAHLGELQHRLLREPETFAAVLDVLTVRVTEMFRDPAFYRGLREQVLPVLRTYPRLKIWHAGCASGEEVYATAILLREEGIAERAHIYATDVSLVAVEQTREGVYPESAFDGFERNYRAAGGGAEFERYFSRAYGSVAVLPSLKRNVHVFQHDLVSDYSLGDMHLIFCRNVLIYFGEGLRSRVFELFDDALMRGGFLCLGSSETLPGSQRRKYQDISATFRIYRRRNEA